MPLQSNEYPEYFATYINLTNTDISLVEEMKHSFEKSIDFLKSIEEAKKDYAYDEGKWTVGQVFQHLIDVELVMAHRAFRLSRMDETNLPGFDHNAFAEVADVRNKSLAQLCEELIKVRDVTNMHFANLNSELLSKIGSVSGNKISVRALGYILVGHLKHHNNILKERYI